MRWTPTSASARTIAEQIKRRTGTQEQSLFAAARPVDIGAYGAYEAYGAYLKG